MKDIVLISIPETTISNLVEQAVNKALNDREAKEAQPIEKPFLNHKEAAHYLGVKIGCLYKLTSGNKIRYSSRGKLNYFAIADLDEYALGNKSKTVTDVADEAIEAMRKKKGGNNE